MTSIRYFVIFVTDNHRTEDNSMENKTGILFIASDRMFGSKDGAPYTESKCVTIDRCLTRLRAYMQEVADYRPNGMWLNENGMLVTCEDACKMTQHYYESYDRSACNNMVTYRFTYRTATGGLLSVVTLTFNDFYKV